MVKISHSDAEILQIVILDLKEVIRNKHKLAPEQLEKVQISIEELEILLRDWAPVLKHFRFGNKYQRNLE